MKRCLLSPTRGGGGDTRFIEMKELARGLGRFPRGSGSVARVTRQRYVTTHRRVVDEVGLVEVGQGGPWATSKVRSTLQHRSSYEIQQTILGEFWWLSPSRTAHLRLDLGGLTPSKITYFAAAR